MEDMKKLLGGEASNQELEAAIARLDGAIAKMSERLETNAASAKKMALVSDGIKKKLIATTVAASVFLLSLTLCTYAYFTSNATSAGNQIATGQMGVTLFDSTTSSLPGVDEDDGSIPILPGYTVEKEVYVKNSGTYPVYVRAKISSVITLDARYAEHQSEVDPSLISYQLDLENWTERDGYYYYNTALEYLQSTTNLLSGIKFDESMGNIYKDSTIKVTVLLETVQASGNGANVFDASGWASAEEGGTP